MTCSLLHLLSSSVSEIELVRRNVSRSLSKCVVIVADVNARTQPTDFVDAGDVPRRSSRRHMVAVYNYDARPTPADRQGEVVKMRSFTTKVLKE